MRRYIPPTSPVILRTPSLSRVKLAHLKISPQPYRQKYSRIPSRSTHQPRAHDPGNASKPRNIFGQNKKITPGNPNPKLARGNVDLATEGAILPVPPLRAGS
jgi:hypothetical protein